MQNSLHFKRRSSGLFADPRVVCLCSVAVLLPLGDGGHYSCQPVP